MGIGEYTSAACELFKTFFGMRRTAADASATNCPEAGPRYAGRTYRGHAIMARRIDLYGDSNVLGADAYVNPELVATIDGKRESEARRRTFVEPSALIEGMGYDAESLSL